MKVETERKDRTLVVRISRPEARCAVDPETAKALFDAFMAFENDADLDVAILTGTGGGFCAGFDLKTAADGSALDWIDAVAIPDDWSDPISQPQPGPMGPSRLMLSKPVIAAIEGHAVAGGMELALWCDLRVVADNAVMGIFCRRWGVPLIVGGTVRLPMIVGQGRANDLVLTGRPVSGREAHDMGLADRVVAPGDALQVALALANDLSRFPQACMRADHLSSRMPPAALADALRREWTWAAIFRQEGMAGASRFASGKGRGGAFDDI